MFAQNKLVKGKPWLLSDYVLPSVMFYVKSLASASFIPKKLKVITEMNEAIMKRKMIKKEKH